jgi:hypothetical protein
MLPRVWITTAFLVLFVVLGGMLLPFPFALFPAMMGVGLLVVGAAYTTAEWLDRFGLAG